MWRIAEAGLILSGWLLVAIILAPLAGRFLHLHRRPGEDVEREQLDEDERRRQAWPKLPEVELERLLVYRRRRIQDFEHWFNSVLARRVN